MIDLTFEEIGKLLNDTTKPKPEDWVCCRECKGFVNRFKLDKVLADAPEDEYGFCRFWGGVRSDIGGCYSGVKK